MNSIINTTALPSAMERKLRSIRRRQVTIAVLRAVTVAAAVLIAGTLLAMSADWAFTLFSTTVRTALTVGVLSLAVIALLAVAVPALAAATRETAAAEDTDGRLPELEERWTTVATLTANGHQPATAAERAMFEQVSREASAMGQLVRPAEVARPQSLKTPALWFVGCSLALAAFLAINWERTSVLLARFWSPQTDITATQLACLTGDAIIPRGETLGLDVTQSGLACDITRIELERETGEVETVDVHVRETILDDPIYQFEPDASLRYRVSAGDARTEWHRVTVVDYPALATVQLTVTAPEYVDRPKYEKAIIPSRVKVIQGSRLKLRMKPAAELERLELDVTSGSAKNAKTQTLVLSPDTAGWYHFDTQLLENITFTPALRNAFGLTNQDKHVCRIQVIADKAPVARIISPTDEQAVAPDEVIDIKFEAHDDHGVATAELVIYAEAKEGEEPKIIGTQPIELGEQAQEKHVLAETQLDLSKFEVQEGTNISYAIRVTDNRMVTLAKPEKSNGKVGSDDKTELAMATQRDAKRAEDVAEADSPSKKEDDAKDSSPKKSDTATEEKEQSDREGNQEPGDNATPANTDDSRNDDEKADGKTRNDSKGNPADQKSTDPTNNGEENGDPQPDALRPAVAEHVVNHEGPAIAEHVPTADETRPRTEVAEESAKPSQPKVAANRTDDENANEQTAMMPQTSESGQNAETQRRRLKITKRLAAGDASRQRQDRALGIRERVVRIDEMLKETESGLTKLVEREVPDAQRGEQFSRIDKQLAAIETYIAQLRGDTKDGEFAFVGLQMVDISRTHVTPARDHAFIGIRDSLGTENATTALEHVVRSRELLAALLNRFDRVARDKELAKAIEEAVKMYEVYIEKTQQLLREARQNKNPLKRKMEVVEVDDEYLERYAEVLRLRREMRAELARILADDPRLLSRYMELVKRRQKSIRSRLTELAERQEEISTELSGWQRVDAAQRGDLWTYVGETRLNAATPLAKDAAELSERTAKQMPLDVEKDQGVAALAIAHAAEIARVTRAITFDVKRWLNKPSKPGEAFTLLKHEAPLSKAFREYDAALEQLRFENEGVDTVGPFVQQRQQDARAVADQAEAWLRSARAVQERQYHTLAAVDQQQTALATELLRVDILSIEEELDGEFLQTLETELPEEISAMVKELMGIMEAITFNQAAATFAAKQNNLERAEAQQAKALDGFDKAEKLTDKIRRAVVAALDEYEPDDPNIADLQDPTLDEFLARLEREPGIEAQLGIPNRPRNIRTSQEIPESDQAGQNLGASGEEAARRAKEEQNKPPDINRVMSEEERQQLAKAEDMKAMLEKSMEEIKKKAEDPKTSPEERRKLEELAKNMQKMLDQMGQPDDNSAKEWDQLAQAEQAEAILRALAKGQKIPDQQWNKLLSTLDTGLWQVKGRTPPEDYRKAIEQYQARIRELTGAAP